MRAEYVLRGVDVIGTEVFYTGKSGNGFVSDSISEAFGFSTIEGARRKASVLNRMMPAHGWRFVPCGRIDGKECVGVSVIEMFA